MAVGLTAVLGSILEQDMENVVLMHDHEQVLSLLETASEYVRAYKCGCNPLWTKDDAGKLLRQIEDALAGREPKPQCDHKWDLWPVADEGWVCMKCGTREYSDEPPNAEVSGRAA